MAFKLKGFKAHNMYKTKRAKTPEQHKYWEEKGYDHSPYDKALVGNQDELPGFLKEKIEASPVKKQTGYRHKKSGVYVPGGPSPYDKKDCTCWKGYSRVRGTKPCAPGSCKKG